MGHKWVICGSHPDCTVGQWVKWVNRYDPLSTLPLIRRNDWQSRIERREESWEGVRHKLFECMIAKEGYPQIDVSS